MNRITDARLAESATGEHCVCPQNCEFSRRFQNIEVCKVCGLGRTSYEGAPPEQRCYLEQDQSATKTARSCRVFQAFMSALEPGSLLDVGCSDGVLMDIAAVKGWSVTGIDPQPGSSERIIRANFADYQFSQRFDFLTFIHSFEHMSNPRNTLLKCRSLLTPTSRLLIVVPNFGGWWARIMGADWQWLNLDDHRYHFTIGALKKLLEQTGFRIDSVATYSGFAPSLAEMFVSTRGVLDWPVFRWRPVRSLIYRLSRKAGMISNALADLSRQGAEIQIVARPI